MRHIALVRPILLYNCQTWDALENQIEKIESFERRLIGRVLRSFYQPGVRPMKNKEVMKKTSARGQEIKGRRMAYLGHNIRHEGPAKKAMEKYVRPEKFDEDGEGGDEESRSYGGRRRRQKHLESNDATTAKTRGKIKKKPNLSE
eukprot:gene9267-16958_t